MKMMVKLTVLLAALLLISSVTFAAYEWCDCYSVTCTNLDDATVVSDHPVVLCFNPSEYNDGYFNGFCNEEGAMILFFDVRNRALAYTSDPFPIGFLEFHGGLDGITGVGYCNSDRWEFRGHRVEDEKCDISMFPY